MVASEAGSPARARCERRICASDGQTASKILALVEDYIDEQNILPKSRIGKRIDLHRQVENSFYQARRTAMNQYSDAVKRGLSPKAQRRLLGYAPRQRPAFINAGAGLIS